MVCLKGPQKSVSDPRQWTEEEFREALLGWGKKEEDVKAILILDVDTFINSSSTEIQDATGVNYLIIKGIQEKMATMIGMKMN